MYGGFFNPRVRLGTLFHDLIEANSYPDLYGSILSPQILVWIQFAAKGCPFLTQYRRFQTIFVNVSGSKT